MATPNTVLMPALRPVSPAPSHRSTRTRRLRAGVLIGASATLAITLLPGSAAADPGDATTSEEAARLVAEVSHELEVVTEEFNEAREVLRQQEAGVEQAEQAAAEAAEELAALDGQIRDLARSAYTSGRPTATLDLMLSSDSADDFVSSLSTLEAIAGHTDAAISEVAAAAEEARSARAEAAEAAEEAAESEGERPHPCDVDADRGGAVRVDGGRHHGKPDIGVVVEGPQCQRYGDPDRD